MVHVGFEPWLQWAGSPLLGWVPAPSSPESLSYCASGSFPEWGATGEYKDLMCNQWEIEWTNISFLDSVVYVHPRESTSGLASVGHSINQLNKCTFY